MEGPQQTGDLPGVGTIIAERYRVCGQLGEGGMAVVYLAERLDDRREVAVKVLRPEIAGDPEVVRRFLQEARAASLVRHRNIVEIIDFGFAAGGVAFLAMERLQGSDLAALLSREGPLPWIRLGPLALQIVAALGAAHRHGIIHRDVKPENCFLTVDQRGAPVLKVLDFGIAKDLGGQLPDRPQTATGMLCGSPEYMAPESIMAPIADARSDLYSLGVTLYELLTGHHPFEGANVGEMLAAHVQRPPPPFSRWKVKAAADVEALVRRCLAKDPNERYADALALGRAIEASLGVTLDNDDAMTIAVDRAQRVPMPTARPRTSRGLLALGGGVLVLVGLVVASLVECPAEPIERVAAPRIDAGAAEDATTTSTATASSTSSTSTTTSDDEATTTGALASSTNGAAAATTGGSAERPRGEPSVAAIRREIARKIAPKAQACLREHTSMIKGQRLAVEVTIDAAGKASTKTKVLARSAAARCIDDLFRKHNFPRSSAGVELTVEFSP